MDDDCPKTGPRTGPRTVLAVSCHPDDIEFQMAGTLFLLKDAGCETHYINVANGSCGTDRYAEQEIIAMRTQESREAAAFLGAVYHDSFVNDLEVFYSQELIRRLTGLIRQVKPDIMLVLSLDDYMEDHMNTARIAVTAAFCRGMLNYHSIPRETPIGKDVMIYHSTPHTLTDGMRRPIVPEMYVNVGSVIDSKERMLACHRSQKEWLDVSQGFDAYLQTMRDLSATVGRMSGVYEYAEGWRRHSHVGFSSVDGNPLADILADNVTVSGRGPATASGA